MTTDNLFKLQVMILSSAVLLALVGMTVLLIHTVEAFAYELTDDNLEEAEELEDERLHAEESRIWDETNNSGDEYVDETSNK